VSPATPFSCASLPNHTKMFELVHVVTSMDDFARTPPPPPISLINYNELDQSEQETPHPHGQTDQIYSTVIVEYLCRHGGGGYV
jgi:hypothetical protein